MRTNAARGLVLGLLLGLLPGLAPAAAWAVAPDPRPTRQVYVDPTSQAAGAARSDPRLAPLGDTAQALWLTEALPVATVRGTVAAYAAGAQVAGRTPLVTLYAIPGRDCGQQSAGGLEARTYRAWVREVAAGLRGRHAMAIVEPDAVALLGDCAGQERWPGLLRFAVRRLAAAGVRAYLDAGHSAWVPAVEMARRLEGVGVRRARGFATNVSNFQPTRAEKVYARQILAILRSKGVRGTSYVVDTSRNGAGAAPDGAWCNPQHSQVGRAPRMLGQGDFDGRLWVKRPGESDGECNGGPPAGTFWPAEALRLLGAG